jgi:hypothetical protein
MADTPSIAFTGTNQCLWPERVFTKRVAIPHTATLPILRIATENEVKDEVVKLAEELGIPAEVPLKQGRWSERGFQLDGRDHLEVTFTTKMFLWVKKATAEDFNIRKKTMATWSGGPRDGQQLPALNGEIVWDGPLGVLVRDQLVVWRDVGEGARAAWALMTSEERLEFRREVEADAEVTVSHDVDVPTPPPPPPEPVIEVAPLPDSPLAALVRESALDMLTPPRP